MKDEYLVRIEALKLTQLLGGISSPEARVNFAATFEAYILKGHPGQTGPTASADEAVPATVEKDPPRRRGRGASKVPVSSGEASDIETEGEIDEAELGRPSTRVAGGIVN